MIYLQTNTTVTVVDTKGQPVTDLTNLPAFKIPSSSEIIATRDIPAARAFTFRFKQIYPITHWHYLLEGEDRYRVVGVRPFETPVGSHVAVDAEKAAGT